MAYLRLAHILVFCSGIGTILASQTGQSCHTSIHNWSLSRENCMGTVLIKKTVSSHHGFVTHVYVYASNVWNCCLKVGSMSSRGKCNYWCFYVTPTWKRVNRDRRLLSLLTSTMSIVIGTYINIKSKMARVDPSPMAHFSDGPQWSPIIEVCHIMHRKIHDKSLKKS